MTAEYQRNIIRYLFQNKTHFIEFIQTELFDVVEYKAIFELYMNYMKKFGNLPEKNNFIQYISDQSVLTDGAINMLKNNLVWVYESIDDISMIEETILNEVKKQMFKNAYIKAGKYIDEGLTSQMIEDIHTIISNIKNLKDHRVDSGLFLLRDLDKYDDVENGKVYPFFLDTVNTMTSRRGFYPPQNIIFMGPPKSFKTGLLIKTATEYMRQGLDVHYCDFENGELTIKNRFKQCLLQCKINEIKSFNSELLQIKDKLLGMIGSGEVFIKKYRKRQDHIGTIRLDIERNIEEMDFQPKVMIYDYVDVMGCSDKSIKDTRLKIQQNYAELDTLNNDFDMFNFTVSKMTSGSWNLEWPGPDDIAEDKEKIYNSHACFAFMRNEEDIKNGLGRMIPIVQREGISYTKISAVLRVDPEHATIEEI